MSGEFVFGLVAGFILGVIGGIINSVFSHWYGNTFEEVKRNLSALDHIEIILDFNLNNINLNLSLLAQVNEFLGRGELPTIRFEPILTVDIPTLIGLRNMDLKYELDKLCVNYTRHNFVISEYTINYPEFRRLIAEKKIKRPTVKRAIASNVLNLKSYEIILKRLKSESIDLMAKVRVVRKYAKSKTWVSRRAGKTDENPPNFEKLWQDELKRLQEREAEQSKPATT